MGSSKSFFKVTLVYLLVLSYLVSLSAFAHIEGNEYHNSIDQFHDTRFMTKTTSPPFTQYTFFYFRGKITGPNFLSWKIPENYSANWIFQIDAEVEVEEKVNHIELHIWIPSTDGKEWKNWMKIRPGSSLRAQISSSYLGDGWYVYNFDTPEGEYFYQYELISVNFRITNPDNLKRGSYNLTKISYVAKGDFAGEERFDYFDIARVYFGVGDGFNDRWRLWEIWTTNENGERQNSFSVYESVYLSQRYHIAHDSQEIYIVPDRDWYDGDLLTDLPRYGIHIIDTSLHVIDASHLIWNSDDLPLIPGAYDVVYDQNNNGIYDIEWDLVCGFRVPGFIVTPSFMVPEYPIGTLSVLGASLLALILLQRKRGRARLDGEI